MRRKIAEQLVPSNENDGIGKFLIVSDIGIRTCLVNERTDVS